MSATATVMVEEFAVSALKSWLLYAMPAAVERVNTERNAVLSAGLPGPYTIPPTANDAQFYFGTTKGTAATGAPVPAGDYTAAGLVDVFNNANPYSAFTAEVDSIGRFSVRTTGGCVDNPATLYLGVERTSGFNAALGWPAEHFVMRYPVPSPVAEDIFDGWPILAELTRGLVIIIGDAESEPVNPATRSDRYAVSLDVSLLLRCQQGENHKSREGIRAALRAVRTALFDTLGGFQLGRDSGDAVITRAIQGRAFIGGKPYSFNKSFNPLYDVATLKLAVTTYEVQGA